MLLLAIGTVLTGTLPQPSRHPGEAREASRTIRLTSANMLVLATNAAASGRVDIAEDAYRALANDVDPQIRAEALYRHGKLLLSIGKLKEAAVLLRRVVDAQPQVPAPRLELARALQLMGDNDGAWREVRAVQASGLPIDVARMVDRYSEALRVARLFGSSLQIALAPDSNINNATRSDTLGTVLGDFDIDPDSKARSGLGLSLNGQMYRRLGLGGSGHALLGRVSGLANIYRKTDFNDVTLDVAAGPELQLGSNRVTVEAGPTQRWYGMRPAVRSSRIAASLRKPIGRQTEMSASASLARLDYRFNNLQDATAVAGRLGVEHALSSTTGVGLNLSAGRIAARDPAYSTKEWRIGLIGWRDVGRATLTAEAEYGRLRADDRLALLPDVRSDKYSRLTIGATFRQLTFGGFAPFTRLVIERNRSTVEFYDYRRRRSEVGLSRAF